MSKHSGPLLGYNNNIPYKGNVYHVQTEDSGTKRPHVFTHLFADGGRIVKTMKTSYAHFIGAENLTEKVRALMREQHKAMVISLRDGDLDALIEEGRAEIEEREAPATTPPPPPPLEPEAVEEVEDVAASKPIDLLERAAEQDDRQFIREIEDLVPEKGAKAKPKRPASDPSAGTYSFVGHKSSPPKAGSQPPPPRRMRAAGGGAAETPPPAVDVAAGRAPAARAKRPGRTDPDLAVAHRHAVAITKFGEAYVTERRFDEVVRAFLEARG